jgi:hypothetical protein
MIKREIHLNADTLPRHVRKFQVEIMECIVSRCTLGHVRWGCTTNMHTVCTYRAVHKMTSCFLVLHPTPPHYCTSSSRNSSNNGEIIYFNKNIDGVEICVIYNNFLLKIASRGQNFSLLQV